VAVERHRSGTRLDAAVNSTKSMARFVLLAMARTGSYMLGSALNSHPEIKFFGELLKRNPLAEIDYLDIQQLRKDADELIRNRLSDPVSFVDTVLSTPTTAKAVGFKLMLGQNEMAVDHYIADRDVLKLLLHRDNMLAGYSSQVIARETGQGVAMKSDEVRKKKVSFVANDFERFRKRRQRLYERARQRLEATNQSYCELEYRDTVHGAGLAKAIAFLGLDPSGHYPPQTRKRNTSLVLERFSNPDEAANYIKQMGRQEWLEDELA
jgi:hypothetical protein